jgi:hypothetical protein
MVFGPIALGLDTILIYEGWRFGAEANAFYGACAISAAFAIGVWVATVGSTSLGIRVCDDGVELFQDKIVGDIVYYSFIPWGDMKEVFVSRRRWGGAVIVTSNQPLLLDVSQAKAVLGDERFPLRASLRAEDLSWLSVA